MYDDQVTVPLVVRAPMGARRGYGPTHSQSLEKLLLGIPNIVVVAASECHDVAALLTAVEDERPVFFIENKLLYGRTIRRPEDGHIGELAVRESGDPYPALTFSATDFSEGAATIVTYGGCCRSCSTPSPSSSSSTRSSARSSRSRSSSDGARRGARVGRPHGRARHCRGGNAHGGFGAEIAARVQEAAWSDLRAAVQRIAAGDGIIPSARPLEDAMLPSVDDVVEAVMSLEGAR